MGEFLYQKKMVSPEEIKRVINELKYPPVHPTITKEDVLQMLEDIYYQMSEGASEEDGIDMDGVNSCVADIEIALDELKCKLGI